MTHHLEGGPTREPSKCPKCGGEGREAKAAPVLFAVERDGDVGVGSFVNNTDPIPLLLETICGQWTLVLEVDGVKTTHVGRRVAVLSYTHEEANDPR